MQAPPGQQAMPQSYPAPQQNPFDRSQGGSTLAAPGQKPKGEEAPLISFD